MPDVRPIDANALKEDLKNMLARVMYESDLDFDHSHAKIWTATITGIQHSIKRLDNAPTIDAVPVVHARWVKDKDSNTYCSHCNAYLPAIEVCEVCMDDEIYYNQEIEETNHCPYCGAKMDGGAER